MHHPLPLLGPAKVTDSPQGLGRVGAAPARTQQGLRAAVLAYAVYDGSRRIVRRNADVENALAQKKLDDEIARRRRTQYAKVAFLKARPEAAFVSMEGKRL